MLGVVLCVDGVCGLCCGCVYVGVLLCVVMSVVCVEHDVVVLWCVDHGV